MPIAHDGGKAEMIETGSIATNTDTAVEAAIEIGTRSGGLGTETTRTNHGHETTQGTGAGAGVVRVTGVGSVGGEAGAETEIETGRGRGRGVRINPVEGLPTGEEA